MKKSNENVLKFFERLLKECYDEYAREHKKVMESPSGEIMLRMGMDDCDDLTTPRKPELYEPVPEKYVQNFCNIFVPLILDWILDDPVSFLPEVGIPLFTPIDNVVRQSLIKGYCIYNYIFYRFHIKTYPHFGRDCRLTPKNWILKRKEIGSRSTYARTIKDANWTKQLLNHLANDIISDIICGLNTYKVSIILSPLLISNVKQLMLINLKKKFVPKEIMLEIVKFVLSFSLNDELDNTYGDTAIKTE